MKTLKVISALAIAIQGCFAVDTKKVEDAIKQSSLTEVTSLLSELDHQELSPGVRKERYKGFYDLAVKTTESRIQNLSITGNRYDMLKTGSGIALGLLGGLMLRDSFNNGNIRLYYSGFLRTGFIYKVADWKRALSCCIGIPALYLLYKGVTCSTQQAKIASAKAIEDLMKAKFNELGGI